MGFLSVAYSQVDAQIRAGASPGSAFLKWTVTRSEEGRSTKHF